MNRRTYSLYLLGVLMLVACDGRERIYGPRHTYTVNRTWPAAQIHELKIFEVSGNVRIDASATNTITLDAEVRGRVKPKANVENQGFFYSELEGDQLRIGRHERRRRHFNFFFDRDDVTINYVLHIPPSVALDLKTVNGRITTKGVEGETVASTVNGTIDVEVSGNESLSASTINGRVRAKFTKSFQGAKFKSVNGGVEAFLPNNASFSVDLAQVNGDFEASFPLSIHSNPGSRHVSGEVNGGEHRLKIVTVNGDVELRKLNDSL